MNVYVINLGLTVRADSDEKAEALAAAIVNHIDDEDFLESEDIHPVVSVQFYPAPKPS